LDTTVAELVGEDGAGQTSAALLPCVTVPGAMDLLESFAAIQDARCRRLVSEMARVLAQRPGLDGETS